MVYLAGGVTFVTAFVALYCSAVCEVKWFRYLVTCLVSAVLAILVVGNLWR